MRPEASVEASDLDTHYLTEQEIDTTLDTRLLSGARVEIVSGPDGGPLPW